jgi:hypothetical protein
MAAMVGFTEGLLGTSHKAMSSSDLWSWSTDGTADDVAYVQVRPEGGNGMRVEYNGWTRSARDCGSVGLEGGCERGVGWVFGLGSWGQVTFRHDPPLKARSRHKVTLPV